MPRSIDKSHYDTGGLLLRRQKIVNHRTGRPFQAQDFMIGSSYELFAFRFRIGAFASIRREVSSFHCVSGDVDAFTRSTFQQRNWSQLAPPLETPAVDPEAAQKNSSFSVLKHSASSVPQASRATALLDVHPVGVPTAGARSIPSLFHVFFLSSQFISGLFI
jgi:hypothetical protein